MTFQVWIPALPQRALSANGGGRSRRDPWGLRDAKLELGEVAYHAVLAHGPNLPTFSPPVVITATLFARHGTKNGDGLYRPTDPSNIGGDVLKPLIDYGLVKLKVIGDDNYWNADTQTGWVREVRLRVEHVSEIKDEGVLLEVEGAE